MASIGAVDLIEEYGSPLAVAEALLLGKVDSYHMRFVDEVVSEVMIAAAKARLERVEGRATAGIKARVHVVLRDRLDPSKKYVAEKDVLFPMDPARLGRICLKVGKKTFSFTVDSVAHWNEESGILTVFPHHNFRPYADEEWLAEDSGWHVLPQ